MEAISKKLFFNYEILKEEKLIIESFRGTMTLDFMKQYKAGEVENKDFTPEMNVLSDVRSLSFDGTTQEIEDYFSFTIESGNILGKRRSAVLYSTPSQHAYSFIYKKINRDQPIEIEVFNDIEKALFWLNQSIDPLVVESKLNKLKQHSLIMESK